MRKEKNTVLAVIFTVLAVVSSLCFCGFRFGFVFVDHEVFNGFCYLLWSLFILNTLFLFAALRLTLVGNKLYNKKLFAVNAVIAGLNAAAAAAFFITGSNEFLNYLYYSRLALPYLGGLYALVFFIAVFPVCSKAFRRFTAIITTAAVAVSAIVFVFPLGGFKITEVPAVFDTGDGYHIVFVTNRESVGYVKLSDGTVIWDNTTGRKDSSSVHSVKVSYDAINNKEYSVGAVRALEDSPYGGRLGKEVTLDVGKFTPCPDDDFDMTCITDNHAARIDWGSVSPSSDIYAFFGDIANGIYCDKSYIDNLIYPAAEISGGVKPVIYIRGNHDHRGNAVPDLLTALDFDSYYYRLNIGKYNFTVFDSGEDKSDDNYEYAGYNDYSSYRTEQLEWSKTLKEEKGYNIILTHDIDIVPSEKDKDYPIGEAMRNIGADFLICGHYHTVKFVPANETKTGIASYICGGKISSKEINFTEMRYNNGVIDIVSKNTNNEAVLEQNIVLKETV